MALHLRGLVLVAGLWAVCLSSTVAFAADAMTYLTVEPQIAQWLPPQPAPGDIVDAGDLAVYFATRPLAQPQAPSLINAQADDVLDAEPVAGRFADALGTKLNSSNAKTLLAMMARVLADDGAMLGPLKLRVDKGGRKRPYVRFPEEPACEHTLDDSKYFLDTSGSYPSGHATYGWIWGLILSDMVPERADALMTKAYSFGQSRLVCGFHYPSDLVAGRMAASALFAQLMADHVFRDDFRQARMEVRSALKLRN